MADLKDYLSEMEKEYTVKVEGDTYNTIWFNKELGWYEAYNIEGYWTPIREEHEIYFYPLFPF